MISSPNKQEIQNEKTKTSEGNEAKSKNKENQETVCPSTIPPVPDQTKATKNHQFSLINNLFGNCK